MMTVGVVTLVIAGLLQGLVISQAGATTSSIAFTTQPGNAAPNTDLATQPTLTVTNGFSTGAFIHLTLTGPNGAAYNGLAVLSCAQSNNTIFASGLNEVASFTGCSVSRGGLYTLTADDSTDSVTAVSSEFFVSGPNQLVFSTQPGGGTDDGGAWSTQPAVEIEDANGNPVDPPAAATISLAIGSNGGSWGSLTGCTSDTITIPASSDEGSFSGCSIDSAGTYTLVANDETDGLQVTSSSVTVTRDIPSQLVFTAEPSGGLGGTAFNIQPAVEIEDAQGNLVPVDDGTIGLYLVQGSATTELPCTETGGGDQQSVNGAVTFSGCFVEAVGSSYKIKAVDVQQSQTNPSASYDITAYSAPFNVDPGPATSIKFTTQPGGGRAGSVWSTQPEVSLTDAGGNPVSGDVSLSIDPTNVPAGDHPKLDCSSDIVATNASGDAQFTGCSISQYAGYYLDAKSGSLSVTSSGFNVGIGYPHTASFTTSPDSSTGGVAFSEQPVVKLTDPGGIQTDGRVTLSITPGTGTPGAVLYCNGGNSAISSNGTATFSGCTVDKAGTDYTLTATVTNPDGTTASTTSSNFDVSVGTPAQLAFSQQPGNGVEGSALSRQPTVSIEDAGGNQVKADDNNIALAVSSGSGSGTLSCGSNTVAAAAGAAIYSGCSVSALGSAYHLTATDSIDNLTVTSSAFSVAEGTPTELRFVEQPSGATAGTVWPTQPKVEVVDAAGNVVSGSSMPISLALTPGSGTAGATLTCSANQVTASAGVATFGGCSVNEAGSGYSLTATGTSVSGISLAFSAPTGAPSPLGAAPVGVPLTQTFGGGTYANNPTNVIDDVNTATGALALTFDDLNIAGVGEPLKVQRSYNSADTTGGSFGRGWTSIFDLGVTISANKQTATVRGEDGQQLVFNRNFLTSATGKWTPPPGSRATLTCFLTSCTVTRFDGVQWRVNRTKLIDYVAEDGKGLHFAYSPGLITVSVETTGGGAPVLVDAHINSTGEITKISTPTRTVSYGYTGGLLTSFTDADGNTWTYTYDLGQLTMETDPLGQVRLSVAYGSAGQVASAKQEGSSKLTDDTYSYDAATQTTTRMSLTNVGGVVARQFYEDQYLNNVLISQTNPTGSVMRYSYNLNLELTEIQDALGWVETLSYDGQGNLIEESTPINSTQSAVVRLTYDGQHHELSLTDADGKTTRYTYTGEGLLASVVDPGQSIPTSYTYNGAGELVRVVSPIGKQVLSYDTAGNRTGIVLETAGGRHLDGRGTLDQYNEAGSLISSVDPRGNLATGINTAFQTTYAYDAVGNLLSKTTPGPQTTTYAYDKAGDPTSSTSPTGSTTTYQWDQSALTDTSTVGSSVATEVYDPSGDLLSKTGFNQQRTTDVYNADGNETATTGPNNVTASFTYDAEGNVVQASDTAGNTISWDYNTLNDPVRTDNNGAVTLDSYDPAGNVLASTDPDGAVTTSTYNALGKVASVTGPSGTTSYTYDGSGDLLQLTDPNHNVTNYTYDGAARQLSSTVMGRTTSYGYDLAGNVDRITDPDGRVTSYTFNGENQPTQTVYSWSGHSTETVTDQYNSLGQRVKMVDPNGTVHNYSYDTAGNLVSASSGSNVFTYNYGTPGQESETYPDGTQITYGLDDAHNIMNVQVGQSGQPQYGQASYIRNSNRQVTGIADSNGVLESDQLNAQGNTVGQTLQNATGMIATDTFTYDAAGNRSGQVDTVGSTTTTSTYGYDGGERVNSFSSAVSTTNASQSNSSSQTADTERSSTDSTSPNKAARTSASRQPASGTSRNGVAGNSNSVGGGNGSGQSGLASSAAASATAASSFAEGYAATQESATKPAIPTLPTSTSSATAFTPASQPSSNSSTAGAPTSNGASNNASYAYDGDGNQLTSTNSSGVTHSTYNASDELTSQTGPAGTTTWSYDGNGDVTEIAGPNSTEIFIYDAADHLVGVSTTTGGHTTTVTYTYDGDGNRTSRTVNGATTDYLWDPASSTPQLALEETSSGALVSRFIYGQGPVMMQTPSQTYFYSLDPLGSVAEMTDSQGAVVASYNYDPFGNVTISGANPAGNPLMFDGAMLDASTGLYDMGARNYDPTTGRFTQRDPQQSAVGAPCWSPYVFAQDAPASYTDPTGESVSTVANSAFNGHDTKTANGLTDTGYGVTGAKLGIAATAKFGGYGSASGVRAAGDFEEVTPEVNALADTGDALKVAGSALVVVGIAVQIGVTVVDCIYGSTTQCVADAVSTGVSIAFTVGCAIATAGTAAIACAIVGAIISIAVSEIIQNYGPQIAAGFVTAWQATSGAFVTGYNDTVAGLKAFGGLVAQGADYFAGFIASAAESVGGAIATGFNEATAAVSSGFDQALSTLQSAGDSALAFATSLGNELELGYETTLAGLISAGDDVAQLATVALDDFDQTATEFGLTMHAVFNESIDAIAGALDTVYGYSAAAVGTVLNAINIGVGDAASAIRSAYGYAANAVATALNTASYTFNQIGAAMDGVFAQTDAEATSIIDGLGADAAQAGTVLDSFYGEADSAAASVLHAAGYGFDQIASGLESAYGDAAMEVGQVLNGLSAGADQLTSALQSAFSSISDGEVAGILNDVGYGANEIALTLKDEITGEADSAVASALNAIGFSPSDIGSAVEQVYSDGETALATVLQGIGANVDDIGSALRGEFSTLTDSGLVTVLNGLNYSVNEVGFAVQHAYALTDSQMASMLNTLGTFTNTQVAGLLSTVYSDTFGEVASILLGLNIATADVASATEAVFKETGYQLASEFNNLGVDTEDIAKALATSLEYSAVEVAGIFNELILSASSAEQGLVAAFSGLTADAAANIMYAVNYSVSQIQSAVSTLENFGTDTYDCLSSGFVDC